MATLVVGEPGVGCRPHRQEVATPWAGPITQKFGLTYHRPQLSEKGYTLVVPLGSNDCYHIDMDGGSSTTGTSMTSVRCAPASSRTASCSSSRSKEIPPAGARRPVQAAAAVRTAHSSTWRQLFGHPRNRLGRHRDLEHKETAVHHDVVRLANGNTVFPVWVELSPEADKAVRGGYVQPKEKLPPLLGDDIVEIDPKGKEVWRAKTWQLFDPRKDPICPSTAAGSGRTSTPWT